MYCSNCGAQLSDDANFCLKCGKPQKPDIQVDEIRWETCEIVFEIIIKGGFLSNATMRFWANAIGQSGSFSAGSSILFEQLKPPPDANHQEALTAHGSLVQRLVVDGWESVGDRANEWWGDRFRRKAGAGSVEEKKIFDLVILNTGPSKIETIKVIRALTNAHLALAKTMAETPNTVVLTGIAKSIDLQAQSLFEKVGAPTEIV